jgi:hypothetical protein
MSDDNRNKPKSTISKEELSRIPAQKRVELFGYDPLAKKEEPFINKWTIIMTLAISGLVIGGTAFFIEFVVQPAFKPLIDTTTFEIPITEGVQQNQEKMDTLETFWVSQNLESFLGLIPDVIADLESNIDLASIKELQLYTIQAFMLTNQLDSAERLAVSLQSRYSTDLPFLSDVYYFRGHIIIKKSTLKDSYGAFSESYALGGRFADESLRIKRKIERMNRPLW